MKITSKQTYQKPSKRRPKHEVLFHKVPVARVDLMGYTISEVIKFFNTSKKFPPIKHRYGSQKGAWKEIKADLHACHKTFLFFQFKEIGFNKEAGKNHYNRLCRIEGYFKMIMDNHEHFDYSKEPGWEDFLTFSNEYFRYWNKVKGVVNAVG